MDESYQILPKWLNILKLTNLEIKIVWKISTLRFVNGNVHFMWVFGSFETSIKGFKVCRSLIQIDGTFLYDKYKGKLLIATSINANGQTFPFVFAII